MTSICNATGQSDDECLTIVGVASVTGTPSVVCVSGSVDYTIATQPTGHEYMVSWAPADTSTPGIKEVVATCGTSAATCTVTVVKAAFEDAEVATPVADGEYDAAANLTEDSYDPEGFVWRLTTVEGDETATINTNTGYVTFGSDWGKYTIRVEPQSLSTCFALGMGWAWGSRLHFQHMY